MLGHAGAVGGSDTYGTGVTYGGFDDFSAMADEMHNFYQDEDFLGTYEEGSTPSLASLTEFTGGGQKIVLATKEVEKKLEDHQQKTEKTSSTGVQNHPSTHESGVQFEGKKPSTHSMGTGGAGIEVSEMGVQNSLQDMQSKLSQGNAGYSAAFEQNVLTTLQALNDKMAEMKANPTVTQHEIREQEQIQNQMIQSMINMSLSSPEVMKNLLAMLKEQIVDTSAASKKSSRRNSTAFESLQSELLKAQEQQRQETQQHFATQAEFQAAMKKQLEEQAKMQMMGIQTNFELYAKKIEEQLQEQQKRWDQELKRKEEEGKKQHRKSSSRKRRKKRGGDSSSSDDSGEELLIHTHAPTATRQRPAAKLPQIKTMQAKILTQSLLKDEDDMKTESQVSIEKIKEKQRALGRLTRMNTSMKFDNTQDAIRRYESFDANIKEKDDDDDDDGEMVTTHIHPVALKKAEIKVQSGTGFTPARPGVSASAAPKIGRIRRIE